MEKALLDEEFRADEKGVSREGRGAAVGRVALGGVGGRKGQDLPRPGPRKKEVRKRPAPFPRSPTATGMEGRSQETAAPAHCFTGRTVIGRPPLEGRPRWGHYSQGRSFGQAGVGLHEPPEVSVVDGRVLLQGGHRR